MVFTISGCSINQEIIEQEPISKTFFEKYDEISYNPQKEFIISSESYKIRGKIDEKNVTVQIFLSYRGIYAECIYVFKIKICSPCSIWHDIRCIILLLCTIE